MLTQSEIETHVISGVRAGFALADITRCGTTAYRKHPIASCEIRHRLYARVLLFKGENEEAAWINVDECTVRRSIANGIKRIIEDQTGIPGSSVMLTATHTHSAHGYDGLSIESLADAMSEAIEFARSRLCPVRSIEERVGSVPKGSIVNRRLNLGEKFGDVCIMHNLPTAVNLKKGELDASRKVLEFMRAYGSTPEKEGIAVDGHILKGPVDERLHLWTLLDEHGEAIAGIARVNAHAATVTQSKVGAVISADFIRPFSNAIETSIGAPCVVFNGAFGNTRPLQKEYSFAECDRIGSEWAQAVLSGSAKNYEAADFKWASDSNAPLQIRDDLPHDRKELEALSEKLKSDLLSQSAPERKKRLNKISAISRLLDPLPPEGAGILFSGELEKGFLSSEWQAWKFGPVRLLSVPGEPFVELCREIEKESGCLVVGLSNGHLSYLPNAESFLGGGFEGSQCVLSFDELNRLGALSGELAGKI